MRKLCVIVMTAVLYAGCATSPDQEPERRLSLLEQADAKLAAPDYRGAVSLYSQFLTANPSDPQVPRARATMAALDRLLVVQTELARVQQQDLPRMQREHTDRQAETERLRGEVAKLKADMERLRNIDLKELQRRPAR